MCYHVSTPRREKLELFLNELEVTLGEYHPYYHTSGFAHKDLPVISTQDPHLVQAYRWGYIPHYTKKLEDLKLPKDQPLNATCENLFVSPMFRAIAQRQRCLIFVDGIYEWRWEDPAGKVKTPHYVYLPNRKPFALGGIYNHWTSPDGQVFRTTAIVTTPANTLMEYIHNSKKRMPFILDKDNWGQWLNPEVPKEDITAIMKKYKDDVLQAHIVGKNLTKKKFDTNVLEIQDMIAPLPADRNNPGPQSGELF